MKALLLCFFLFSVVSCVADTYTGIVSGVKHFSKGGVAVDLDGHYPDQKMTFYIPAADVSAVGALPAEGAKVTATGTVIQYKGHPEIKVTTKDQWKF